MKTTHVYTKTADGKVALLSHRNSTLFSRRVARRHLSDWLTLNSGGVAWLADQWGEATPPAEAMERKARRLYALRLCDPHAPEYCQADKLLLTAQAIRGA